MIDALPHMQAAPTRAILARGPYRGHRTGPAVFADDLRVLPPPTLPAHAGAGSIVCLIALYLLDITTR